MPETITQDRYAGLLVHLAADHRRAALTIVKGQGTAIDTEIGETLMAEATGERRAPKAGEWFISSDIGNAHFALRDLRAEYLIARLVVVKKITHYRKMREVMP